MDTSNFINSYANYNKIYGLAQSKKDKENSNEKVHFHLA